MSELITRTARLIPYLKRPKQVPSFVTAYSHEPLADEPGAELGSFYVALEVLVSGRASEEVADLIIETIGDHYYNQPATDKDKPLERFEAAIKAVNHELGQYVSRGNAAWIGKLSAVVAIQVGDELHVSRTGSAEAYLYRSGLGTHITSDGPAKPATPTKTFGSIASGQLEPGDRLLLATPALIHQFQLDKLQDIISGSGPNNAIAELTDLLHGVDTDRIAALILEITTPELAALQVRSEQPDEIQLGAPENTFEAAKMAAAPLATATVTSSKKVAEAAGASWKRARPHARNVGFAVADALRDLLADKTKRRWLGLAAALTVLITVSLLWFISTGSRADAAFTKYQAAYNTASDGDKLLATGSKSAARASFTSAQQQLAGLKLQQALINRKLAHTANLPSNEPTTFSALSQRITDQLDVLDGLVKVAPVTVANLPDKKAKTEHFEVAGGKAYVFDSADHNALSIITLTSGTIKASAADFAKLGDVKSTTLSSNNDGIYLLTGQPSVWFYRFDTDSLSQQTIALGQWPNATAVGVYFTNLYLLADNTIYKHVKNATGFSPKTDYLAASPSPATKDATALTVDGYVYILSPSGLHRFASGTLKLTAAVPAGLTGATKLRSTTNGTKLVTAGSSSQRLGFWSATDTSLTLDQQITLTGTKSVTDATYDPKTNTAYALADGRLVRFSPQP